MSCTHHNLLIVEYKYMHEILQAEENYVFMTLRYICLNYNSNFKLESCSYLKVYRYACLVPILKFIDMLV